MNHRFTRNAFGVLALSLLSGAALAQTAPAPARPPAPPAPNEIPYALAKEAAEAAMASCEASGYRVAVMVTEADQTMRVFLRADGTGIHTPDVSRRKIYTVFKTGMDSLAYAAKVGPVERAPDGFRYDPSGDKEIFLAGGGNQIKKGDRVVGAIAVSGAPGGDKDDVCAKAGIAKIADRLK